MFHTPAFPQVSIIMPTYNRAKLIMEAVQSIVNQTYSNWQLIIVDDGSEDNTAEVIAGLKDDRITCIEAGRIGVSGKIKNIGLENATGEFIAFLDSDDLWAPTKLEKQLEALSLYPEAGFCLTGGYNFKTPGHPIDFFYKETHGTKFGGLFEDYFASELPCFTQALLLRKKCMEVVGLFKEAKAFSDVDFIVCLARHFKAIVLYEPLVYRRKHDWNWIESNWKESYYEGIEIIKEYKSELPKGTFSDALFRLHINFGEKHMAGNETIKACSKFIMAWRYRPWSIVPLKKIGKAMTS